MLRLGIGFLGIDGVTATNLGSKGQKDLRELVNQQGQHAAISGVRTNEFDRSIRDPLGGYLCRFIERSIDGAVVTIRNGCRALVRLSRCAGYPKTEQSER